MIVGILSDTHGWLPIKADCALAECDHIIHAGDICDKNILRQLAIYAPVTAVLGNNDYPEYGPEVGRFAEVELDGVRFLVAHYPHDVMGEATARANSAGAGSSADAGTSAGVGSGAGGNAGCGLDGDGDFDADSPVPDVCVHGHTHVPRILSGEDAMPAKLLVCPGSVSRPRGGSPATIAKVAIEDGQVTSAVIECIDNGEVLFQVAH